MLVDKKIIFEGLKLYVWCVVPFTNRCKRPLKVLSTARRFDLAFVRKKEKRSNIAASE